MERNMITVIVAVAIAGSLLGSGMAYADTDSEKIQSILDKVTTLETKINAMESKVNAMDARIFGTDNMGMGLEHLHSKINVIYDGKTYQAIAQMYHWLKNVNHHFAADTGIARETHNWMNDMRGDVSSIRGTVNNLPDQNWISANVDTIDADALNANLTSIRDDITGVSTTLTGIQSTLGTLPTQTWVGKNVIGNVTYVGANVTTILGNTDDVETTLTAISTTTTSTKTVADDIKTDTTNILNKFGTSNFGATLGEMTTKIGQVNGYLKTISSVINATLVPASISIVEASTTYTNGTDPTDTPTLVITLSDTGLHTSASKIYLGMTNGVCSTTGTPHLEVGAVTSVTHSTNSDNTVHTFTNLPSAPRSGWNPDSTTMWLKVWDGAFVGLDTDESTNGSNCLQVKP